MKYVLCLAVFFVFSISLSSTPRYPFPQAAKYANGIMPANISNDRIQACYTDFYNRLYEESGDMARIKWDTESMTVSEGIGYGMIIMVYMDNAANNTQSKFDKLWKYYNNFLDSKGLMNWKINGFSGPTTDGRNAATDAELDASVGLLEAYKQWDDEKYLTDAKALIGKIWKYEIDSAGGVLPGDSWGVWASQRNPSYSSTAGFQLFKMADSSNWNRVITNAYSLLMKARNATTGLVPAWCSNTGQPQGTFQYDAIRTPWRMAWAYCWYGHDTAKTISSTIASWITAKTSGDPAKIVDEYNLDGSNTAKGKYNNGTFVGCLASAGMVDAQHQTWLNAAYKRLQDTLVAVKEVYFSQSLKLLNLLLMSGNMPDFWNLPVEVASPRAFKGGGRAKAPGAPSSSWDARQGILNFNAAPGVFSIDIYNSAGKRIEERYRGFSKDGRFAFPLGKRLQPGVYWLRLNTAAGSSAKKIITIY